VKTESGVVQWVLLFSQKGVITGWNGKVGDGCGEKTPWDEGFLFLVYHVAQSFKGTRQEALSSSATCYKRTRKKLFSALFMMVEEMLLGREAKTMAQATPTQSGQEKHEAQKLGPFLCWALVFADIGTKPT
jgi:hypothetical protein